jgi:hypothetical protein
VSAKKKMQQQPQPQPLLCPVQFFNGNNKILVDARGKWDFLYQENKCTQQEFIDVQIDDNDEMAWLKYMSNQPNGTIFNLDVKTPLKFIHKNTGNRYLNVVAGIGIAAAAAYTGYKGYKYVRELQNRYSLMQDKLFQVDGALRRAKSQSVDIKNALTHLAQLRLETDQVIDEFQIPQR